MKNVAFLKSEAGFFAGDIGVIFGIVVKERLYPDLTLPLVILAIRRDELERDYAVGVLLRVLRDFN
jgi:hypothetical protein